VLRGYIDDAELFRDAARDTSDCEEASRASGAVTAGEELRGRRQGPPPQPPSGRHLSNRSGVGRTGRFAPRLAAAGYGVRR